MAKLFLSYAREDTSIADRLARGLERSGQHHVWWDRDLQGGASFGPEIEQQLRNCDVVIVLWTTASVQSPWVRDEAAIGRDAGKLLPLSLGEIAPPIGFRQYHMIDLGRAGRASSPTIQKIERAIEHFGAAGAAAHDSADYSKAFASALHSGSRIAGAAGALLLVAAVLGVHLWRNQQRSAQTVAILPVTGGQTAAATDYSRSISTDMASFLSAHGNSASVLDQADADVGSATYRFNVGYSGRGRSADTSLSMTAQDQRGIIWSQSWSVPDVSSVNLKKRMSFAAARALLCAMEARNGRVQLDASFLKLYIVACSGFAQSDVSQTKVESDFSLIVQQEPGFAPAWQNLAVVRSMIVYNREAEKGAAPPALRSAALDAIARARQLTPRSGKILLAEAALAAMNNSVDPLDLLNRAIALEPNEAIYYAIRSTALLVKGRSDDAVADSKKATELDPLSPAAAGLEIYVLMCAGKLGDAKDQLAVAYKVWPNNIEIQQADFMLSLFYGDPRHAEKLLSKVGHESGPTSDPFRKMIIAREKPTPANVEDSLEAWQRAAEASPALTTPYLLALGMFGRMDEALKLLNHPKAERFVDTATLFRSEFKDLRSDKRFMGVAAQYGLVRYWKSTGNWPDFCRDSGLTYDCTVEAAKYPG